MITITVGDILDGEEPEWEIVMGHRLYIVHDGDVVFYVGQSQDVADRILAHLGQGYWGWAQMPSLLGRLISDNLPESRDWQVVLMTAEECTPLVEDWVGFKGVRPDTDFAEKALIRRHRPCLNVLCNEHPTSLPEKYRKNTDLDAEARQPKAVYHFDLNGLAKTELQLDLPE